MNLLHKQMGQRMKMILRATECKKGLCNYHSGGIFVLAVYKYIWMNCNSILDISLGSWKRRNLCEFASIKWKEEWTQYANKGALRSLKRCENASLSMAGWACRCCSDILKSTEQILYDLEASLNPEQIDQSQGKKYVGRVFAWIKKERERNWESGRKRERENK